ncbi:hypothetical protein [Cumulibacter soli]|uniref:hypothetical protein n=1 Tax=Cumulibacter soli TaxID=2546344 RepID=UPI00106821A3|nr:hypothetical protein [Cumulibacter soli]
MTSPHESHESQQPGEHSAELGSTGEFRAFVAHNDDPDEARARAAADPDGPRSRSTPAIDEDNDREIRFSDPTPPVRSEGSLRPNVDLPPAELGSTAQFRAFAGGESAAAEPADDATARPGPAGAPAEARKHRTDVPSVPATANRGVGGARGLIVTAVAVVLVVLVVVLLFVLF